MLPDNRSLAKLVIIIVFPIFLFGCSTNSAGLRSDGLLNWKYADLRALDPSDTQEPDQDLIAIYTRFVGQSFQIRIDFLSMDDYFGSDISIALDTNFGGISLIETRDSHHILSDIDWDFLIGISGTIAFSILNSHNLPVDGIETFIMIDQAQDRMIISLPRTFLPVYLGHTNIQVFTTSRETGQIIDQIAPVGIDTPPPPRAQVLFEFWNTFSAASPAETLRSWAGAHSGPMSSRHGLQYLIEAMDQTEATLFILDPLTPQDLSALDYIEQMPRMKSLIERGLLIFPVLDNDQRSGNEIVNNWLVDEENYKNSLLLKRMIDKDSKLFYNGGNDYAQPTKEENDCDFIDLSMHDFLFNQIPISCKKLLISSATSPPVKPLTIGGDFRASFLGNPSISRYFFEYIYEHPWIQILTAKDLGNLGQSYLLPKSIIASISSQPYLHTQQSTNQLKIAQAIELLPRNNITDLASEVFNLITQPENPAIYSLSAAYLGQVGEIIAAAEWADKPYVIETCETDLDYDGVNECLLANEKIFMVVEPQGGYVPFMFSRDDEGIHQIIGPTWEFMLGISDPSEWNPDLGVRADNRQILGAFQDSFTSWNAYQTDVKPGAINLLNAEGTMIKAIHLFENHTSITIQKSEVEQFYTYIPLAVDPWVRFSPGWGDLYTQIATLFSYTWGLRGGETVTIGANIPLTVNTFSDSKDQMLSAEDPNYDYAAGHYLPYPMSLVTINLSVITSIDIHLSQ